jgi:selenocysteine-specific elongation factor
VVTGTLIDGKLCWAKKWRFCLPACAGASAGLQSHKRKEQNAVPGSRTAVNISGLEVEQIRRGRCAGAPGQVPPTRLVDVHFRLLPDASAGPPQQRGEILSWARLKSWRGCACWASKNSNPAGRLAAAGTARAGGAVRGDRYILRRPSPGETLGGGVVVDPHPRRHRRFDEAVLARLESLRHGSPADVLLQAFQAAGALPLREAVARARLADEQARPRCRSWSKAASSLCLSRASRPGSDLLAWSQAQWQPERARRARAGELSPHSTRCAAGCRAKN